MRVPLAELVVQVFGAGLEDLRVRCSRTGLVVVAGLALTAAGYGREELLARAG